MADYQPISREILLARGSCCNLGCYHCPYRPVKIIPKMTVDPRILEGLKSGLPTVIYSDRQSLVPELTIQNVTIIYKPYAKQ